MSFWLSHLTKEKKGLCFGYQEIRSYLAASKKIATFRAGQNQEKIINPLCY